MTARRPATAAPTLALVALALLLPGCREKRPPAASAQAGAEAPTPPPSRVFLFFPGDDTLLHREVREVREVPEIPGATTSRVRAVIEELLAGSQNGLPPALPWAATVEAVFVDRGGAAYVDFSSPPEDLVQGSSLEVMLVYAVVNTVVANCPGVERVQLLFGGREVATLGHLDLSRPLPARPQLVAK